MSRLLDLAARRGRFLNLLFTGLGLALDPVELGRQDDAERHSGELTQADEFGVSRPSELRK